MTTLRAHILPAQPLDVYGDGRLVVDFSDRKILETAFQFLRAYVRSCYAIAETTSAEAGVPILIEHNRDGGRHGTISDLVLEDDGIWGPHSVTGMLADPANRARYPVVSPSFWWAMHDNTGKMIPMALVEVSYVSVPHIMVGQQPVEEVPLDIASISGSISAHARRDGFVTRHTFPLPGVTPPKEVRPMDPALIEAVKQIVTETVTGLKDTLKAEIVAEIKAAGAAMEAAEEVAEAPMPAPVTPMAAAAPATVPVEMVTQMAARVTSAVSGNPALAALIPDIAAAYARGEAEGDAFVKRLGALPRAATTPTDHPAAAFLTQHAAPGPAKPKADPAKLRERAIQIQREHERRTGKPMKYADAIKAAEAQ